MTAKEAKCWLDMLQKMTILNKDKSDPFVNEKIIESLEIAVTAIDMNIEKIEIEDGGKS